MSKEKEITQPVQDIQDDKVTLSGFVQILEDSVYIQSEGQKTAFCEAYAIDFDTLSKEELKAKYSQFL